MPELPEVESLAAFLRQRAIGRVVTRVDVAGISALKTYDPPPTSLAGLTITAVGRAGKFLDIDVDGLHLVVHLARAGWLHWKDKLPTAPPRPGGKNPLALRVHLDDGSGFDLTEQGTRKGLAVYVVRHLTDVDGVTGLGPDALTLDRATFAAILRATTSRLKTVLTDQHAIAGIGNAYSDEILHVARLSPYKRASSLTDDEVATLLDALTSTLRDALDRSSGQEAADLKGEKRSGMRVHGRKGLPCPDCGDDVRSVHFADSSLEYCATCQTNGQPLSDRRLDRLLK
ncbi:MAG: formamidopyrimidine-DNA glycosylase [Frankiaceae bacterium]|jgi:formamidopyrimidine-DNA glycosylase|nr:formamidopyrimidine-DNA glycosylase [Frankiaceae bacterium]MDQ1725346.1 formamidopyrimidine-DNA glycosylase [Frankiaceae bacterium]